MKTGGRLLGALALLAAGLVIAACGSNRSNAYNVYHGKSQSAVVLPGGDPQNTSAGTIASYSSTGQLVADNGFRPQTDGFSFENYGNDAGAQNMIPADVQTIFGDQVCASGSGADCQLTPPAQQWMTTENQAMAGGHCEGFSVTALRLYSGSLKLDNFGSGSQTSELQLLGNATLQQQIAKDWTFQEMPLVQAAQVKGTPTHVLDTLISGLKDKSEYYTVGIYKADGSAGHAVTPYAVEDDGNGISKILIYDNNFPGVTREITVDRNTDTWQYQGGPNPSNTNELYQGDASTQTLSLEPISPGEQQQPCPFCNGQAINASDSHAGSVLGSAQEYNSITLGGDPNNHAHLILTDDHGRQSGLVGGKRINDIPGVKVEDNLANQDWTEAPEPTYHVPVSTNVKVTIDGSSMTNPDTETLDLTGPGDSNSIQDIKINPGQKDTVSYTGDGTGFTYQTDPQQSESPILGAGVQGKSADYGFAVKGVDVRGGSRVALQLDQTKEQLDINTAGTPGAGDYVVSVYREDQQGKTQWTSSSTPLHLASGEVVHVDYASSTQPGMPLKLVIRMPNGSTRTSEIPEG